MGRLEIEALIREIERMSSTGICEEREREIRESVINWEAKRFAGAKSPEAYRSKIAHKKAELLNKLAGDLLKVDGWSAPSRVGALMSEAWGVMRLAHILVPDAYDVRYKDELSELFSRLKDLPVVHDARDSVGVFVDVVSFHGKMRWYVDQILAQMAPDPLTLQEIMEIEGGSMAGSSVPAVHKPVLKRVTTVMHECWNVFRVIHTTFPHPDDAPVMELVRRLFSDLRSVTDAPPSVDGLRSVFVQVARLRYRISGMIARIQHHFGSVPITVQEILMSEKDPFYFIDRVALTKERQQVIASARDTMWKI